MKCIVMPKTQYEGLDDLKKAFIAQGKNFNAMDFEPIELDTKDENGDPYKYLPLSVLQDPNLSEFYQFVDKNKKSEMVIREVAKSEFKVVDPDE